MTAQSAAIHFLGLFPNSNSHYETDLGVSSAFSAGNTQIGFLKARRWRAFKKPIFIICDYLSKTKGALSAPFVLEMEKSLAI